VSSTQKVVPFPANSSQSIPKSAYGHQKFLDDAMALPNDFHPTVLFSRRITPSASADRM